MKKPVLGVRGTRWLKGTHLIFSVIWLGAALSMSVLRFVWVPAENGDLYAADHSIGLIDNWVVVPMAWASLLSGLFESWLTTWGFFKYRWVTVKWIMTVGIMVYGTLALSRWDRAIQAISQGDGLLALQNPMYLEYRLWYGLSGIGMIAILAFLSIMSTLKPWMKKGGASKKLSQNVIFVR